MENTTISIHEGHFSARRGRAADRKIVGSIDAHCKYRQFDNSRRVLNRNYLVQLVDLISFREFSHRMISKAKFDCIGNSRIELMMNALTSSSLGNKDSLQGCWYHFFFQNIFEVLILSRKKSALLHNFFALFLLSNIFSYSYVSVLDR